MLPQQKARYYARAIGCYFGRAGSDGTGNVQVFVPCEVTDGEFTGERITWPGTFGEGKSTGFTIEALRNFGWQGEDLSELEDLGHEGAAQLLPDIVELSVDMETYLEESTLKVKWVNKPGGARMTRHALFGEDLKAFAAQMRGTLRGGARPAAPRTAQPQPPARRTQPTQSTHPNAPGADEDIPF
jgi:hypothetical protein